MNIFSNLLFYLLIAESYENMYLYLAQLVVVTVSTAIVYHKLNKPWWAAFIPIYSEIILLKIARMKLRYVILVMINYLVYFVPVEYVVLWQVSFLFQMGEFGIHLWAYAALSERFNRGILLPFLALFVPWLVFPIFAFSQPREYEDREEHYKWNQYFGSWTK